MRATHTNIPVDRQGRRLQHMSLAQRKILRQQYEAKMPVWRQPIIGYLVSILLVALAMFATSLLRSALGHFYFPGAFPILAVLFVAIVWGVGPSLLALALSAFLIDYSLIPSADLFDLQRWLAGAELAPFMVSGLTIAIITAQRERERLKTVSAEQELQAYADELETINQKLEDANQMKDRFLSIASHELKTPITTIRGQAQLAQRRLSKRKPFPTELTADLEGVQLALTRINDQTGRLNSLIDELLDSSSIRNGKVEMHKRKGDLREICREVVEDQRLLTGRTIQLEMPPDPVNIAIDRDRMSQVFVNLVSNAVKYSPEEKPIEIYVYQEQEKVHIQVKDHGKGIRKDQQKHIFETFYRTPDAQSSAKKGLGLGLAISKEIVERHSGLIWCESEHGAGSTFIVELPRR